METNTSCSWARPGYRDFKADLSYGGQQIKENKQDAKGIERAGDKTRKKVY